ncbi:MAG: biotin/lipoyl-binding protein, partial [Lacrimispora sphenoides]
MNKKKVHIIAGITSVVLIVAIVAIFFLVRGDKSVAMDYTVLYRTDLINSISAKGIVESQDKRNVYSTATATIETVYIKVGDKVSAGDLLCQLDTEDLRLNLTQQNVEFTAAQQSGLKGQQDNQSNINSAKLDLDTKTTDYNNTKVLYEAGDMSKSELDQAKAAYTQAQNK